jgi:DNA (cytosine-5)-methyltransferase 1
MEGTITVEEASSRLNVSYQTIRAMCRDGVVNAEKIGNLWLINESSVNHLDKEQKDRIRMNSYQTKKPKVLSFFSGAMGLDLGIERAGFEVILSCEVDKFCRQTIMANKPDIALIGDIRDYTPELIRQTAGLKDDEEIDVIIGGPPCQAFSTAGKRKGFEDERGNVFLTYIEHIIALQPKFAVIENVRGLLSSPLSLKNDNPKGFGYPPATPEEDKGGALMHIIEKLQNAGYGVSFNLYNAANFGTPQKRERVVIICSRDGATLPYLVPTHSENGDYGLPKWRTFKEAVDGLENINHEHLNFPEKRIKYYKLLKPGQYWKHLPENLQLEALGKSYYAGGGKTGFFRRLGWDEPSPTLVTHPAMPATDLAHPEENRPLSIQEYKRVQEFPDGWIITGNLTERYKQVGNAVPSSLGYAIGKLLLDHMNGNDIPQYEGFSYSRYRDTDHQNWIRNFQKKIFKAEK